MSEVNQDLIARRLNISRATVSRCFTNHPGINPMTRARVFQLAAELGYTHLEKRTGRTTRKAGTIFGILICTDEEDYFRGGYQNPSEQILAGVTECARLNGATVETHLVSPQARGIDDPSFPKLETMRRSWAGILLVYPFPSSVIEQILPIVPVVSLVEQSYQAGIDCVDVDHYKGIAAAVEHLYSRGHRRIGFYTRSYQVEASWSLRRYSAFMEMMVRLRLPIDSRDVVNIFPSPSLDREKSIDAVAERTKDGTTAWVCAADHQAYDVIQGLKKRGLKVPKDVSITGFDGIEPPKGSPRLSTVQIPFREIGGTGTMRLIERSRKRFGSNQHVLVDCMFVPGTTVADI